MDDRVEIPIVTTADTKGAKQTAAALNEVSKATQAHGEAAQEAGKKAEFLGLKHGELKKTVRELGREFPLAGAAARALMNPLVFLLTIVIGLFAKAKNALSEWNAAMDEASKRAADATFQAGIMAKKEAMHAAAIAQEEFVQGLKSIGAGEDGVIKKLEAAINKWHDYAAAQAEVNNAAEAAQIAQVNLAEKLGKLTPEQGIIARSGIKQRFATAGDTLKTQAEQNELAAKQAELDNTKLAGPQLQAQQAAAAGRASALAATLKQRQTDLEKMVGKGGTLTKPAEGSELAQYQAQVEEMEKAHKRAEYFTRKVMNVSEEDSPGGGVMLENATANLAGARNALAGARRLAEKLDKSVNAGSMELPAANQAAKNAAERATANETRRKALEDEVAKTRASQATAQKARGIVGGLKAGENSDETFEQLAGTGLGKQITDAAHTADVVLAGQAAQKQKEQGRTSPAISEAIAKAQNLSSENGLQLDALAKYFESNTISHQKAIQIIAKANDRIDYLKAQYEFLEKKIANVDSKQKYIGPQ